LWRLYQRLARDVLADVSGSDRAILCESPSWTIPLHRAKPRGTTPSPASCIKTSPSLELPGFMCLVIEHIGSGPRNGELVSIAHYDEQAGDLRRDLVIVFAVVAERPGRGELMVNILRHMKC
jgi:hypothetical protein